MELSTDKIIKVRLNSIDRLHGLINEKHREISNMNVVSNNDKRKHVEDRIISLKHTLNREIILLYKELGNKYIDQDLEFDYDDEEYDGVDYDDEFNINRIITENLQRVTYNTTNISATAIIDDVCPICLDSFNHKKIIVKTLCNHHFHKKCIAEWLRNNFTCPSCKYDQRELFLMII